jgi:hypothetical protein
MSLLQILATAWGISGREVQRTLGAGVPGFRRVGRGHYRALGPLTAARLRRVRPLDGRLPVALWMGGGVTLGQAAGVLSGDRFAEAVERAAPFMEQARFVLLALEERMANHYDVTTKGYFLRRQETFVSFASYAPTIADELGQAQRAPDFVALRTAYRRLKNRAVLEPTRKQLADEMGLSLRSHVAKYSAEQLQAAGYSADKVSNRIFSQGIVAQESYEALLAAMRELGAAGRDASPDDVAEMLGYGGREGLFSVYTLEEYNMALEAYDREAVVEARREWKDKDDPAKQLDVVRPERHGKIR